MSLHAINLDAYRAHQRALQAYALADAVCARAESTLALLALARAARLVRSTQLAIHATSAALKVAA